MGFKNNYSGISVFVFLNAPPGDSGNSHICGPFDLKLLKKAEEMNHFNWTLTKDCLLHQAQTDT